MFWGHVTPAVDVIVSGLLAAAYVQTDDVGVFVCLRDTDFCRLSRPHAGFSRCSRGCWSRVRASKLWPAIRFFVSDIAFASGIFLVLKMLTVSKVDRALAACKLSQSKQGHNLNIVKNGEQATQTL